MDPFSVETAIILDAGAEYRLQKHQCYSAKFFGLKFRQKNRNAGFSMPGLNGEDNHMKSIRKSSDKVVHPVVSVQ